MNDSFVLTATKNTVEMNQEKEMLKNILPEFIIKKVLMSFMISFLKETIIFL